MRTVLNEICLFNNKLEMHDTVFISKQFKWEESKTAERQRERESVRDSALIEMRGSVGNKIDRWRKFLWQMWE